MSNNFIKLYLDIISEDVDKEYHGIREITTAVKTITNGCQQSWIKGQTGQAVLNFLSFPPEDHLFVSDFQLRYIANYWKVKANSGNKFDVDMANDIEKAVEDTLSGVRFPHAFLRFKVGIIAYGVWKALNVKQRNEENNRSQIENSNVDKNYANISNKKLKVIDWKLEYTTYGSSSPFAPQYPCDWRFICLDENNFKVNVKVKESDKIGCAIVELLNYLRVKGISKEEAINKVGINEITIIKATLGKINKEYKTIYLNRTIIQYPSQVASVEVIKSIKKDFDNDIEQKFLDKLHEVGDAHDIVRAIEEHIKSMDFQRKPKEEQISWIKLMKNILINEFEKTAAELDKEVAERLRNLFINDLKESIGEVFPNNKDEYINAIF